MVCDVPLVLGCMWFKSFILQSSRSAHLDTEKILFLFLKIQLISSLAFQFNIVWFCENNFPVYIGVFLSRFFGYLVYVSHNWEESKAMTVAIKTIFAKSSQDGSIGLFAPRVTRVPNR